MRTRCCFRCGTIRCLRSRFPGKLQSYLAAGIPIIGMLNGEGTRIIEDSQAGIACAAGDSAGLAAAVLRWPDAYRRARRDVATWSRLRTEEFDRQRLVENLDQHMQTLVRANPRKEGRVVKRAFDLLLVSIATLLLAVPIVLVALAVEADIEGSGALLVAPRGTRQPISPCRSSAACASARPTGDAPAGRTRTRWITPLGWFLRRTSLDELPQLWSMLARRHELRRAPAGAVQPGRPGRAAHRSRASTARPGVTGWAQVNGRDELPIPEKVKLDAEYLRGGRSCSTCDSVDDRRSNVLAWQRCLSLVRRETSTLHR